MSTLSEQAFADKTVVITGSTSGIGEAVARRVAKAGAAAILVTGRNSRRGRAVAEDLRSRYGTNTAFVAADLADSEAGPEVISAADRRFGRIDVLVNSAGDTSRGSVHSTTAQLWDRIMAINLRSPFFLIQETVRVMRREGNGGTIVNVGSVAAHGGPPILAAYAASKAGLAALTRNIAYAVMPDRIRVNCLQPGWAATPAEDAKQRAEGAGDEWLARASAQSPFGRLLNAEEIAEAIVFLASDASGLMTGAVVDYDQTVQGAGRPPQPSPRPESSQ